MIRMQASRGVCPLNFSYHLSFEVPATISLSLSDTVAAIWQGYLPSHPTHAPFNTSLHLSLSFSLSLSLSLSVPRSPSLFFLSLSQPWRTGPLTEVIGMAVCGDTDMAALATIWAENLQLCGPFVVC